MRNWEEPFWISRRVTVSSIYLFLLASASKRILRKLSQRHRRNFAILYFLCPLLMRGVVFWELFIAKQHLIRVNFLKDSHPWIFHRLCIKIFARVIMSPNKVVICAIWDSIVRLVTCKCVAKMTKNRSASLIVNHNKPSVRIFFGRYF